MENLEKQELQNKKNKDLCCSLFNQYYLNKEREKINYLKWEKNEYSWIWSRFYEAEKTIAAYNLSSDDSTFTSGDKIKEFFNMPDSIPLLQISVLIESLSKFKNELESYSLYNENVSHLETMEKIRKLFYTKNNKYQKNVPDLVLYSLQNDYKGSLPLSFCRFGDSISKLANKNLNTELNKKGIVDIDKKEELITIENVFIKDLIPIKDMLLNYLQCLKDETIYKEYCNIEFWKELINKIELEYKYFLSINQFLELEKDLKSKIEIIDISIKNNLDNFNYLFSQFKSVIDNADFEFMKLSGWYPDRLNTLLKLIETKTQEYVNINNTESLNG